VAEQAGCRQALVETAIAMNAAWTAFSLREESHGGPAGVEVVYGVYDLATRRVGVPLAAGPDPAGAGAALLGPPRDAGAFRELGRGSSRATGAVASWPGDIARRFDARGAPPYTDGGRACGRLRPALEGDHGAAPPAGLGDGAAPPLGRCAPARGRRADQVGGERHLA
jgi:hypothetical protein